MRGTLILRDLSFGTVLAKLDDFTASGPFPRAPPPRAAPKGWCSGASRTRCLDWVSTLECDTRKRICGVDLRPDEPEATGSAAPLATPVEPGADIALDNMVENRPGGSLTKLVGGAIDPDQVIAASTPVEPVAALPTGTGARIGTTVAALGLLGRSGFWLQTPLVSEEMPGRSAGTRPQGGACR